MGEAEAHSALDKLENPIKLTEQGIRDLKADLDKALQALAEVKSTFDTLEKRSKSGTQPICRLRTQSHAAFNQSRKRTARPNRGRPLGQRSITEKKSKLLKLPKKPKSVFKDSKPT